MSRIKLTMVTVLAVMAASTAYTSVAAAVEFELTSTACGTGSIVTACWSKEATSELFEFKGEESFTATLVKGTETLLQSKFGESEVHIVCTGATATGTFLQHEPLVAALTADGVVITFTGCALLAPLSEKCKVPTELKTKAISGTFPSPSETKFKPESGEIFIEIDFTGEKCPETIAGEQPVKGEQTCTNVSIETPAKEHEQTCVESGSKLKLGKNEATFKLATDVKGSDQTDFGDISKA